MNRPQDYQGSDLDASASRTASTEQPSEPDDQVREIQRGIEETRAEMSETLDALQQRLNPTYLKEQVKEQVAEQMRQVKDSVRQATIGKVEDMVDRVSDSGRSIGETIKSNPIPSALVGIGLAWLWMNRRSDSRATTRGYAGGYGSDNYGGGYDAGRYDDRRFDYQGGRTSAERYGTSPSDLSGAAGNVASRASNAVSNAASQVQRSASDLAGKASSAISGAVDQAQQKAGYLVDQAQQKAGYLVDQAQQKAGYIAERAQYQARRVEDTFNQTLEENPVALGAIALALGTAVGLALPQTRKENELMGSARDALVDKAQSAAHDAIDQVQQVAQKVTSPDSRTASGTVNLGSSVNVGSSPSATL